MKTTPTGSRPLVLSSAPKPAGTVEHRVAGPVGDPDQRAAFRHRDHVGAFEDRVDVFLAGGFAFGEVFFVFRFLRRFAEVHFVGFGQLVLEVLQALDGVRFVVNDDFPQRVGVATPQALQIRVEVALELPGHDRVRGRRRERHLLGPRAEFAELSDCGFVDRPVRGGDAARVDDGDRFALQRVGVE